MVRSVRAWQVRALARATGLCLGAALAATAPGVAAAPREPIASPSAADLERARSLYAEGRELYLRGNWGGAIVAFEYSYELSGDPNLLYNISLCYDRLSAFAQAIEYMTYYRELATPAEHADLDAQIASLQTRRQAYDAKGRSTDAARPLSEPGLVRDDPSAPAVEEPRGPRIMTPGLWTLAAFGAAGFAVAAGTGPASLVATSRVEGDCASSAGTLHCRDDSAGQMKRARGLAIATDVALGVGAVVTVVFVALLATRIKKIRRGQIAIAPGGLGATLRF